MSALRSISAFSSCGGDPGRARLVLDHLGERLAGHVHAAVDAEAGRLPGRDPAVEHRHVRVAERRHPRGGARRQTFAVVAPHDACRAPRHQIVDQQLQPAERHARRHQQMARGRTAAPRAHPSRAISPPSCSRAFSSFASIRVTCPLTCLPPWMGSPVVRRDPTTGDGGNARIVRCRACAAAASLYGGYPWRLKPCSVPG